MYLKSSKKNRAQPMLVGMSETELVRAELRLVPDGTGQDMFTVKQDGVSAVWERLGAAWTGSVSQDGVTTVWNRLGAAWIGSLQGGRGIMYGGIG